MLDKLGHHSLKIQFKLSLIKFNNYKKIINSGLIQ